MSRFVGQIGKYIATDIIVLKKLHRGSWNDKDITRYLYVLMDSNGNILTITTPSGAFKPGESWKLIGRVKRHKEFNGAAQTHIVRWSMEQSYEKKGS
jgi:hypothetical protein